MAQGLNNNNNNNIIIKVRNYPQVNNLTSTFVQNMIIKYKLPF